MKFIERIVKGPSFYYKLNIFLKFSVSNLSYLAFAYQDSWNLKSQYQSVMYIPIKLGYLHTSSVGVSIAL